MKRLSLIGGVIAALLLSATARAEIKIAFVDVQRALNECDAGKKAKADFRSRMEKVSGRLEKERAEVQSLKDELEKKGMLMKEDERRSLQDQVARKARDFERDYKDTQEDLQRRDNEVTGSIVRDIARIIRNLGEKDGYTVVMEKGGILWGAPAIDITDQVIRTYNALGPRASALETEPGETAKAGAPASGDFGSAAARHSTISK